jgi:hypothetical protein
VADEHHVMQVFPHEHVDDVLNMRIEVNVCVAEVGMLALPR